MFSSWQTSAPLELLSKIFLLTLPDLQNREAPSRIDSKELPLLLTTACRLWRYAALNTPRLWSHLQLPAASNQLVVSAIHRWLALSKPFPVTLRTLVQNTDVGQTSFDVETAYIKALCAHSQRWRGVQLHLAYASSVQTIVSSLSFTGDADIASVLPALEQLDIRVPPATVTPVNIPHDLSFLTIVSRCPKLESLTVTDWDGILSFPADCLPPTLRHLRLAYSTPCILHLENLAAQVSRCTDLSSLDLDIPCVKEFIYDSPVPISLRHLGKLTVSALSHKTFSQIISSLSLPLLQDISLTIRRKPWPPPFRFTGIFREFVRQCGSNLHTLQLSGFSELVTFSRMAQGFFMLKKLILHNMVVGEVVTNFLDAFTLLYLPNESEVLKPGQNLTLHSIEIEVKPRTLEKSPQDEIQDLYSLFAVLAQVVRSRSVDLSASAKAVVAPFKALHIGQNLAEAYRQYHDELCQYALDGHDREQWESIRVIVENAQVFPE